MDYNPIKSVGAMSITMEMFPRYIFVCDLINNPIIISQTVWRCFQDIFLYVI